MEFFLREHLTVYKKQNGLRAEELKDCKMLNLEFFAGLSYLFFADGRQVLSSENFLKTLMKGQGFYLRI